MIEGVKELVGAPVKAMDLRAGAAMVVAGLLPEALQKLENIEYIERGYENIVEKITGPRSGYPPSVFPGGFRWLRPYKRIGRPTARKISVFSCFFIALFQRFRCLPPNRGVIICRSAYAFCREAGWKNGGSYNIGLYQNSYFIAFLDFTWSVRQLPPDGSCDE